MSKGGPVLESPFLYHAGERYRFRLDRDCTVHFPGENFGYHKFCDAQGRGWLSFYGASVTVHAGYAWDGASPKLDAGGAWIGTPDFDATRLGTLFHDAFYQFLHIPCFPISRIRADQLFGDIMRAQGFRGHWLYSGAVMIFGGLHRALGGLFVRRSGSCAWHAAKVAVLGGLMLPCLLSGCLHVEMPLGAGGRYGVAYAGWCPPVFAVSAQPTPARLTK